MDDTWKEWGHGSPYDPAAFIPANHAFMNWLMARTGGHLDPSLASYNWSLGGVLKVQRRVKAIGEPGDQAWVRLCPVETQNYLKNNTYNRAVIERKLK
jgi:soluble lytic murein transglycosylase-like protein